MARQNKCIINIRSGIKSFSLHFILEHGIIQRISGWDRVLFYHAMKTKFAFYFKDKIIKFLMIVEAKQIVADDKVECNTNSLNFTVAHIL